MKTTTEYPRSTIELNLLEPSTEFTKESLIDSERLKWKSYLNDSKSNSDLIRLSLTEYIHNLVLDQNRSIFHLTTTYKPYQDRIYSKRVN